MSWTSCQELSGYGYPMYGQRNINKFTPSTFRSNRPGKVSSSTMAWARSKMAHLVPATQPASHWMEGRELNMLNAQSAEKIRQNSVVSLHDLKRAWRLACLVKARCAQAQHPQVSAHTSIPAMHGRTFSQRKGSLQGCSTRHSLSCTSLSEQMIGHTFLHGGILYCVHKIGQVDDMAMGWYHDVCKFPSYPPAEYSTNTSVNGIEEALLVELQRRCLMPTPQIDEANSMKRNTSCRKRTRTGKLASLQRKAVCVEKFKKRIVSRPVKTSKSSAYRGVSWHNSKWKAQISIGGLMHFLGYFHNEELAARAYDKAAKVYRGDKATINFSDDGLDKINACMGADAKRETAVDLLDGRVAAIGARLAKWQRQKRTSSYRGVSWQGLKWKSQISIHSQMCFLGYFKKEEDAARAYDEAAKMCRGPNAIYLNFKPGGDSPDVQPAVVKRGMINKNAVSSVSKLNNSCMKTPSQGEAIFKSSSPRSISPPGRTCLTANTETSANKPSAASTSQMQTGESAELEIAMLMATNFEEWKTTS